MSLKPLTFEGRFECGFNEIVEGKVCAVTSVLSKDGKFGLGIAVANEPGYYPVPLHWARADTYEEMHDHANALNAELFNLTPEQSLRIIVTTMRRGK